MLGLRHGVNLLVDYDPAWATALEAEKNRIEHALKGVTFAVEHYGSTAIPGLRAKPMRVFFEVTELSGRVVASR